MPDVADTDVERDAEILLRHGFTPHRTALEDYVAYQWEVSPDLLGERHARARDTVVLRWLREAATAAGDRAAILDVGCSYGNHLFMLDAMLGKPQSVRLVGVDLHREAVLRATAFARRVPGYSNCSFEVADIVAGLPFSPDSFDAVNLCDVLEHLVDPRAALEELRRVAAPGGAIVISTPLRDSLFKRLAAFANRVSDGRVYRAYYGGKSTELDASGRPVMEAAAGHEHVSEMTLPELRVLCSQVGLVVEDLELMPVMSGSRWFDEHGVLLAGLVLLETVHEKLRRPTWAHSVVLRLRKP
jgi:SAM-dependent methyltransferase